jgi:hypothetical protein
MVIGIQQRLINQIAIIVVIVVINAIYRVKINILAMDITIDWKQLSKIENTRHITVIAVISNITGIVVNVVKVAVVDSITIFCDIVNKFIGIVNI